MKVALDMDANNQAVVIPVILRPCDWQNSVFGHLMATPLDGKAVTKFPNYDDAFLQITQAIKQVVSKMDKAHPRTPVNHVPSHASGPLPRSSHLKIYRKFTDHEKDTFLDDGFSFIANYFEGSLIELKRRNPEIETRFKQIDSQCFTATAYVDGKSKTECMIFLRGPFDNHTISFSNHIASGRNSMNESLSITESGEMLTFKGGGNSFQSKPFSDSMTNEGAAEYFWEAFLRPLQSRH